jgi:hypothetical protein
MKVLSDFAGALLLISPTERWAGHRFVSVAPSAQCTRLPEHHDRFGERPPVPLPRLCLRTWRAAESLLQLKSGTRDAAGVDMHPGQLAVSPETVRELLDAQFPWWRGLAIKPVDSQGTVNAIFRIGDHLAARLPLEPGDPGPARRRHPESEARAARELAGRRGSPRPSRWRWANPGRATRFRG